MKNDKNAKIVILVVLVLVFILCFSIIGINYSKDEYSLSIVEKKWLTNNVNNVIDVSIFNDIPVYGYNGDGVSFDFLNKFTEEYNIKLNTEIKIIND